MLLTRSVSRVRSATRASVLAALLALGACLDGPFAHLNPHDVRTDITLSIVGGLDTVRVAGETVFFQLATDPVTSNYQVSWSSAAPIRLTSAGLGRFTVGGLPATPTSVLISATIGANVATRSVVVMPVAP